VIRILLVGNYLFDSKYNKNVWQDLAEHLRDTGHSVIMTSKRKSKILRLVGMLFTVWNSRKYYQVAQIDVFSGPAFLWAYFSAGFLHFLHKPFILTLHGGNLPTFSQRYPCAVSKLFGWASAVTSPSTYLLENMKTFRGDIQLIPNGINIEKYPFRERSSPVPILIWLRAFHAIYNPMLGPNLIAALRKKGIESNLTMIGPDKGDGSLQSTLRVAEEQNVIELIEVIRGVPKQEVPAALSKGDIFINTTNIDNTPVSVIEAMACGLCIVSTRVGGIPYLLEDGVDALLVPPDDADAMAYAVERILTEPGLAGKLSANARKKAEQFDWSIILPKWRALFEDLMLEK